MSSLIAPGDYTATVVSFTFSPRNTIRSASVPITNDALLEGAESFNGRLSTVAPRATLDPAQATVFIVDDDSKPAWIGLVA